MAQNKVTWTTTARVQIGKIIEYISQDSIQNDEKVYTKIMVKLLKVADNPGMCPPDKFKRSNNGKYRALIILHYRISYRIEDVGITILRVRHSSMKPKYY